MEPKLGDGCSLAGGCTFEIITISTMPCYHSYSLRLLVMVIIALMNTCSIRVNML